MPEEYIQSEAVENFLKAVYVLQRQEADAAQPDEEPRVSTNALARTLNIAPPSVTDMARRMVNAGLVNYRRYYGVMLTPEGETIALNIIRRHRLIELYLVEELDYSLHEVHDEAERLEHAVSERFIEAIAAKLDHPEIDPHGDPIPTSEGTMLERDMLPLAELPIQQPAYVSRLIAEDGEMLEYILNHGFKLEVAVEVHARDPFDGPLTVIVDGKEQILGHNVAKCVLVEIRPVAT